MVRFGGANAPATEIRFVQQVRDPDAEAHAAQGVVPDGVFIRAADGTEVDATQPVNAVIEIQQQSQSGSTFLLGHELAHNLLDVLRRTGTLTEEMDAALAERFRGKDGAFDEEAFADAFGAELRDAFTTQEDARLNEPQGGKVRKILRTLAGAVRNWIYAVNAMAWRREAQAVADSAGSPQNVASVLEAFLRKEAGAAASGAQQDQGAGTAPTGNRSESPNSSAQGAKYHVPPPADENIAIANEGVTEETFTASLDKMLQERVANGSVTSNDGLRDAALGFYREFHDKKVQLSDGRFVYFVPSVDEGRGLSRDEAWAEYAIHSVTNDRLRRDGTHERAFNSAKASALKDIERILKEENVFASVNEGNPSRNAIVFVGEIGEGNRIEIVTRLDEAGNINADLTEITTVVKNRKRESPRLTSLAEAVRAARQGTDYPPMTDKSSEASSNTDVKFHIPNPTERFSETGEGKRVVAEVLDALIETNPAFVFDRERAVDGEANASEGKKKQLDETLKRLDGIKAGLTAEQWQDVLGTAFEVSGRFDVLGETNGVISPVVRERMAGYLQDIVRNRATMLGRRAYMAGRNFAWRRAREEHGEVLRSLSEKRAKERKGLREDISRLEGDLRDIGREYRELETQAEGLQARVNYLSDVIDALNADKADLRERMREAVRAERVRQARKDAVRREVGVTSKQLKDVEQVKLAYSDTDIETAAGEMVKRATSRVGRLRILG